MLQLLLFLEAHASRSDRAGIVFKADIGAAVENEAACITKTKQPLPRSYGAKQRFARRFDESLLVRPAGLPSA